MEGSTTDAMDENWKKVFRSSIFMDCWLSYTLGYTSEVTPADVRVRQENRIVKIDTNRTRSHVVLVLWD